MNLLVFFALPLATIILAAVLQTVLKSPILVAAFFFAVYLIVAFAAFDETFLIAVLVYTLLALITAIIVNKWRCIIKDNCNDDEETSLCDRLNEIVQNANNNNSIEESLEDIISNNNSSGSNNSSTCGCNRYRCRRF